MKYAYIRVSTKDQHIDRQLEAMKKQKIVEKNMFVDKQSGKDFNRINYRKLLKKVKEDDVIYIKSIDRLGRNYEEIIEQWHIITKEKNAHIVVLDFPLLNTTNAIHGITGKFIGDLVLQILSYVAQIERENIKQRQKEGIKIALDKGVHFGRPKLQPPPIFQDLYWQCKVGSISIRQAATQANVCNHTFKKWMEEYEDKNNQKV